MSDLEKFVRAQEATHADALRELRAGQKVTHWIWWEMPQLAGLGRSARAREYGLDGVADAQAWLAHPVLGPRLLELCRALLSHRGAPAETILGPVDAMKVRSMATLFAAVPDAPPEFAEILAAFYGSDPCPLTGEALAAS